MDIIHYQLNLSELFAAREQKIEQDNIEARQKEQTRLENKKQLLKYVLPFMHGVLALHNHKCEKVQSFFGEYKKGLLGLGKRDIDYYLDSIASGSPIHWNETCDTFSFCIENKTILIWLNSKRGCYQSTPHLPYSMSSFKDALGYGKSIEDELISIAQYCARYTEDWD